jgi:hypothetical protein
LDGVVGSRVPEEVPGGCTRPVFRIPPGAGAEQIGTIRNRASAVLVFGPNASASEVTTILDALQDTVCSAIVLATRESLTDFQRLVDDDRLFYLACGELPSRELDALIDSALGERKPAATLDRYLTAASLRRIALAQSIAELTNALRAAAAITIGAERTRCVLFDSERGTLWVPDESDSESTAAGLVGFIFRTGVPVCLPHLDGDVRFDRDLDNPEGDGADRFLGVPILVGGKVVAVLTAMRPAHALPFEPLDIAAMEALAAHASPYAAAWLDDSPDSGGPFRLRALRAAEQTPGSASEPLQLESAWMRRATWLFFASLLTLLVAFVVLKGWLGE